MSCMISDIIFQLVVDLDHYLTDPDFDHAYIGEIRLRITRWGWDFVWMPQAVLSAEIEVTKTSGHHRDGKPGVVMGGLWPCDHLP